MTVIGEVVVRARHAAALADDPLAAGRTAQLLLDAVGCAIGGLGHPLSRALAAMLGPELGRTPRSRVLAGGLSGRAADRSCAAGRRLCTGGNGQNFS